MSFAIRLKDGAYLDLPANFALQFELNNQVFSDGNASVLPGSFSFPSSIPCSKTNKRLFNNPELVNNASNFKEYPETQVFIYGVLAFEGTLTITKATPESISFYLVSNPLKGLKPTKLNQIDLGGDRIIGNSAAMLSHALATTAAPLDFDYVFFPIFNPGYLNSQTDDARCKMQNAWDASTEVFQVAADYPALTPFIRAEYIISKIFDQVGSEFQFYNEFQLTDELKSICIWNGYSLWRNGLSNKINLKNHVDDQSQTDWLRKFMGVWCLGLFTNIFKRTIKLIPLKDLLTRAPKHDWTDYLLFPLSVESPSTIPQAYDYASYDSTKEFFTKNGKPSEADVLGTYQDADALQTAAPAAGIYYLINRESWVLFEPSNPPSLQIARYYDELGPAPIANADRVFEIQMQPMHDIWPNTVSDYPDIPPATGPRGQLPYCYLNGDVIFTPTGATEPTTQTATKSDRFLIYRGMQADLDGQGYPCACSAPFDAWGDPIGTISTRLGPTDGVYEKFWKAWHTMLLGKNVPATFAIPITKLMDFSFEDKIRVINLDYFVKKIRVGQLLGDGLISIEVSLVSTI